MTLVFSPMSCELFPSLPLSRVARLCQIHLPANRHGPVTSISKEKVYGAGQWAGPENTSGGAAGCSHVSLSSSGLPIPKQLVGLEGSMRGWLGYCEVH